MVENIIVISNQIATIIHHEPRVISGTLIKSVFHSGIKPFITRNKAGYQGYVLKWIAKCHHLPPLSTLILFRFVAFQTHPVWPTTKTLQGRHIARKKLLIFGRLCSVFDPTLNSVPHFGLFKNNTSWVNCKM